MRYDGQAIATPKTVSVYLHENYRYVTGEPIPDRPAALQLIEPYMSMIVDAEHQGHEAHDIGDEIAALIVDIDNNPQLEKIPAEEG